MGLGHILAKSVRRFQCQNMQGRHFHTRIGNEFKLVMILCHIQKSQSEVQYSHITIFINLLGHLIMDKQSD
jgi:hypothetical protein